MPKERPHLDVAKSLRAIVFKSLIIPALLLVFFIAAPHWLDSRIHTRTTNDINADPNLTPGQKEARLAKLATINFQQISLDCPAGMERAHAALKKAGIVAEFQRLQWGLFLSILLMAILAGAVLAIFFLNRKARNPQELIPCYRLAWKISIAAALANVFLLVPLLAYGTFEFTVLLSDQYFPKLLLLIILGGLTALWRSVATLVKNVPLEFKEPMSREVTPAEAPELWEAVREAARRLQTEPPDRIIIGLQLNFYVTELAVLHDSGKAEGRTLFLSYPLLKGLSEDEVLAIIGHELGHFMGADTKLTREFYPLRLKFRGTLIALARSGWIVWPSFQLLNLFHLSFAETEQQASRERELLADQKGAFLTSPRTAAQALLRFQVLAEAFQRGLKDAVKNQASNPLNLSLQPIVRDQLAPEAKFWTQLFEKKLPHPLDSHPALHVRLESLGQTISPADAQSIALAETNTAYEKWFLNREALFGSLVTQAEAAVDKMRLRAKFTGADYQSAEGKELLEQHFPEKKWRVKPSGFWAGIVVLGFLVAGCLAGAVFIPDIGTRLVFGLIGLFVGALAAGNWIRHRDGQLTLNADGIVYSGWKRPLRFSEVEKLFARRKYSNITLVFRLKAAETSRWKFSLPGLSRRTIGLSLSGFDDKPSTIAQTAFRYFTRQIEKPKS